MGGGRLWLFLDSGDLSIAPHVVWDHHSSCEGEFRLHVKTLGKFKLCQAEGLQMGQRCQPGLTWASGHSQTPGKLGLPHCLHRKAVVLPEGTRPGAGGGPGTTAGPICGFQTLFAFSASMIFIRFQHWLFDSM